MGGNPFYLFLFAILFVFSVLFLLEFATFHFSNFYKTAADFKTILLATGFLKSLFLLPFSSTLFSPFFLLLWILHRILAKPLLEVATKEDGLRPCVSETSV